MRLSAFACWARAALAAAKKVTAAGRRLAATTGGATSSRRLCSWLHYAAAGLEGCLHHLCDLLTHTAGGSWVLTVAAWWLLISAMWVLALLLEQPGATAAVAGAAATPAG